MPFESVAAACRRSGVTLAVATLTVTAVIAGLGLQVTVAPRASADDGVTSNAHLASQRNGSDTPVGPLTST